MILELNNKNCIEEYEKLCLITLTVYFCFVAAAGCISAGQQTGSKEKEMTTMYITIQGNKREITLADNASAVALVERLQQGNITYTADDYGGFEKVGSLGFSLPQNDVRMRTQPGDVILYQGNQIVLFYGSNSWSYTRIGKMEGLSQAELRSFFGAGQGEIQVTLSLD